MLLLLQLETVLGLPLVLFVLLKLLLLLLGDAPELSQLFLDGRHTCDLARRVLSDAVGNVD